MLPTLWLPLATLWCAAEEGAWQDIPLGLDPRVLDLLGNSIALNTTASVRQAEGQSTSHILASKHSCKCHCELDCCTHQQPHLSSIQHQLT